MPFEKKQWIDRLVEHPGRFAYKPVHDRPDAVDITRAEGAVAHEGDRLNAATMNDLEARIGGAFADVEEWGCGVEENLNTLFSRFAIRGAVNTMAELSKLTPDSANDSYIVLDDEQRGNQTSVYYWTDGQWKYAGRLGIDANEYYDKGEADDTFLKLTGGTMAGHILADLNSVRDIGNSTNRWRIGYFTNANALGVTTNTIHGVAGEDITINAPENNVAFCINDSKRAVVSANAFRPATGTTNMSLGTFDHQWNGVYGTSFTLNGETITEWPAGGGGGDIDLSSVGQHIVAAASDAYDIGTSTNRWRSVFCTTVNTDNLNVTNVNGAPLSQMELAYTPLD